MESFQKMLFVVLQGNKKDLTTITTLSTTLPPQQSLSLVEEPVQPTG